MEMVLNKAYGGFQLPRGFKESRYDYTDEDRFSPDLVQYLREHPETAGDLRIVSIPDNYTDFLVQEYDGFESVLYVIDGKIHRA